MEDIQVQRRQERARAAQYGIRNLGDHPIFARFMVESSSGKSYEVTIRSLQERANSCTCPDFLTNLVGTCKHVEAVLLQVTPPEGGADEGLRPVRPHVYLHYGEEVTVRLLWTPHPLDGGVGLQPLLERYFRSDGTFRGDLATEFEGFRQAAEQRRIIDIAPEVISLVKDLRDAALLRAERAQWLERLSRGERLTVTALPLYPYQERGVLHLAYGRRSMLADDIGLGKTVQAIGAAELLRREGRVKRVLIVCPASVRHQWKLEIFRFAGQESHIAEGESSAQVYERPLSYTICSYEQVQRDLATITTIPFDLIVLDEAQRIRDWRSKVAAAVKQLKSPFAFVLTGTPLEHRLDALYSVMQFLDQRLLGPLWRFNQRYYVLENHTKVVGIKNLDELRTRLAPVVMRRLRHEVRSDLPDQITKTFEVEMIPAQRHPYDDARTAVSRVLAKTRPPTEVERGRIIKCLARMRMACSAPELVGSESPPDTLSPKLQELERVLSDILEEPGAKVVIFSEWERMVQLAAALIASLNRSFLTISGKLTMHKRAELLEQFATDDGIRILLSTDVTGANFDLEGAGFVINLDVPWSLARLEQRVARVRTRGTSKILNVINIVARGSIEHAILALHDKKRALHDSLSEQEHTVDRMPLPTLLGQLDRDMLKALVESEPVDAVLAEVPQLEAAAVLAEFSGFLDPAVALPGTGPDLPPRESKPSAVVPATPRPPVRPAKPPPLPSVSRPSAPPPAGPHPGRFAGTLPADPVERHQVVRRIFAEALGSTFKDLVRLGAGFVLLVNRFEARVQVQANGVAARLGVPILALDADGFRSLEQVIAPLAHGNGGAVEGAPEGAARQAAARCERARMRLAEAKCLLSGGLGPATVRATFDGMELAVEALCLAHTGTCPPPADLVGELYGRLVHDGVIPLDLAAAVSRAKDLSHVAEGRGRSLVDATIARAVLHDAETILDLALRLIGRA